MPVGFGKAPALPREPATLLSLTVHGDQTEDVFRIIDLYNNDRGCFERRNLFCPASPVYEQPRCDFFASKTRTTVGIDSIRHGS